MSFLENALVSKVASYLLARLTESNTVLAAILRVETSLHIDKLPPGFNQDLTNGVVWLVVAAIALLPQNWKPAASGSAPAH